MKKYFFRLFLVQEDRDAGFPLFYGIEMKSGRPVPKTEILQSQEEINAIGAKIATRELMQMASKNGQMIGAHRERQRIKMEAFSKKKFTEVDLAFADFVMMVHFDKMRPDDAKVMIWNEYDEIKGKHAANLRNRMSKYLKKIGKAPGVQGLGKRPRRGQR